jgi:hypothetical protein
MLKLSMLRDMRHLLDEVTAKMNLPTFARKLFLPDGTPLRSITSLQSHMDIVVSTDKAFLPPTLPSRVAKASRPAWNNSRRSPRRRSPARARTSPARSYNSPTRSSTQRVTQLSQVGGGSPTRSSSKSRLPRRRGSSPGRRSGATRRAVRGGSPASRGAEDAVLGWDAMGLAADGRGYRGGGGGGENTHSADDDTDAILKQRAMEGVIAREREEQAALRARLEQLRAREQPPVQHTLSDDVSMGAALAGDVSLSLSASASSSTAAAVAAQYEARLREAEATAMRHEEVALAAQEAGTLPAHTRASNPSPACLAPSAKAQSCRERAPRLSDAHRTTLQRSPPRRRLSRRRCGSLRSGVHTARCAIAAVAAEEGAPRPYRTAHPARGQHCRGWPAPGPLPPARAPRRRRRRPTLTPLGARARPTLHRSQSRLRRHNSRPRQRWRRRRQR